MKNYVIAVLSSLLTIAISTFFDRRKASRTKHQHQLELVKTQSEWFDAGWTGGIDEGQYRERRARLTRPQG